MSNGEVINELAFLPPVLHDAFIKLESVGGAYGGNINWYLDCVELEGIYTAQALRIIADTLYQVQAASGTNATAGMTRWAPPTLTWHPPGWLQ